MDEIFKSTSRDGPTAHLLKTHRRRNWECEARVTAPLGSITLVACRKEIVTTVNRTNRSNRSVTVAARFRKGAATVMERFEQMSGFSLIETKSLRHDTTIRLRRLRPQDVPVGATLKMPRPERLRAEPVRNTKEGRHVRAGESVRCFH